MTAGPVFDPLIAAAMSSETTRAAHTDAEEAREHMTEDLVAARLRTKAVPRRRGLGALIRRLLRRDR